MKEITSAICRSQDNSHDKSLRATPTIVGASLMFILTSLTTVVRDTRNFKIYHVCNTGVYLKVQLVYILILQVICCVKAVRLCNVYVGIGNDSVLYHWSEVAPI